MAEGAARPPAGGRTRRRRGRDRPAIRLLRGWDAARGALRPTADPVLQTWLGAGRWTIQYALPVAAASLARPGWPDRPNPAGPPAGGGVAAGGPPLAEWRRIRPPPPAASFVFADLADEAANGAGVYRGAI